MDIKEKIEEIVGKIKSSKNLAERFEKEPVKLIEELVGVDLPDDVIEKIIDGVKAKISVDDIKSKLGGLGKLFK